MNGKRWLVIFCFVALAAVVILASSLHDVRFQPGRPLPRSITFSNLLGDVVNAVEHEVSDIPLWKGILFWVVLFIYIVLFLYLLPPEIRKRLIRQFIRLAISALALYLAFRYHLLQLPELNLFATGQSGAAQSGLDPNLGVAPFQPPDLIPWLTYLISFSVTLALLALTWLGYRWWRSLRARSVSPLNAIADIAQSSLNDLVSGREWSDVIVQSYARMSEAVSARRGLQRAEAMTPREFAERLGRAGLPANAVGRLTQLFESARYGARRSSQSDVNEAISCLNSILQACGVIQ